MKNLVLALGLVVTIGAAGAWIRQNSNLYVNGSLASSGVFMHNGVACVPVRDIATALHLTVVQTGRGLELSASGGANQVTGATGKVGDVLWNGYVRFQAVKLIRGKTYTNQFTGDNQVVTPAAPNDDLVVLVCRIKNGLTKTITVEYPGDLTAVTDTDGHSFQCRTGLSADIPSRGFNLLPGAAYDFALTFDVPSNATLGDFIYQTSLAGQGTNGSDGKKFRISLAP